jgi:class 3 adenylate cyclase
MTPLAQESIGRAIVKAMSGIEDLALPDGLQCVPAIGLASGSVIQASLEVAGRILPVEGSPAMNLAMRLSASCGPMKKKVLFSASLPVTWPPDMVTEDLGPLTIKGKSEQIQLMSLHEKRG